METHFTTRNRPAIAYGSGPNEYLVVWEGDDNLGGMVDGESEIFGQRIAAADRRGGRRQRLPISDMGPTGDGA